MNKKSAFQELRASWGESPANMYELRMKGCDRMYPEDHEHQEHLCLDWASSEEVSGNTPYSDIARAEA